MIDKKRKYRFYNIAMAIIIYILVHCWIIFNNDLFMYISAILCIARLFYNPFSSNFWKCNKCGKIVYEIPLTYCNCHN